MRVSPELTEDELQKVVIEARELIIQLYLTCEQDFETGLNIYKAIVEQLGLDTIQRQTETLEKQIEREGEEELMVKNEVKNEAIEENELMVKNEVIDEVKSKAIDEVEKEEEEEETPL